MRSTTSAAANEEADPEKGPLLILLDFLRLRIKLRHKSENQGSDLSSTGGCALGRTRQILKDIGRTCSRCVCVLQSTSLDFKSADRGKFVVSGAEGQRCNTFSVALHCARGVSNAKGTYTKYTHNSGLTRLQDHLGLELKGGLTSRNAVHSQPKLIGIKCP